MPIVEMDGLEQSDGVVFKTVPAGKYRCRISGVEENVTGEKSKYPGSPTVRLKFKVVAGEDCAGHVFPYTLVLPSPDMDGDYRQQCVDKFKNVIVAADLLGKMDGNKFDFSDFMDGECEVLVNEKETDGKKQNNVVELLKLG